MGVTTYVFVVASLLALGTDAFIAQSRTRSAEPVLRVETSLVLISVSATDINGKFVGGLQVEDFELRDNGKLQRLSSLVVEEGPISLCIVLDVNGSMKKAMPFAREACAGCLIAPRPKTSSVWLCFTTNPLSLFGHFEPVR